jgi:hypothetical protein
MALVDAGVLINAVFLINCGYAPGCFDCGFITKPPAKWDKLPRLGEWEKGAESLPHRPVFVIPAKPLSVVLVFGKVEYLDFRHFRFHLNAK